MIPPFQTKYGVVKGWHRVPGLRPRGGGISQGAVSGSSRHPRSKRPPHPSLKPRWVALPSNHKIIKHCNTPEIRCFHEDSLPSIIMKHIKLADARLQDWVSIEHPGWAFASRYKGKEAQRHLPCPFIFTSSLVLCVPADHCLMYLWCPHFCFWPSEISDGYHCLFFVGFL